MADPNEYFLTTQRLGFRRWSPDDFPLAIALWGDPEVTRLIGGPFTHAQIEERLRREIESMAAHKIQYWPLFLLRDGSFIGCGGLRPYNSADRIFELGVHIRPQYWRQGFAEEAARAAIAYGFETLGATALFAGHHPQNAASRKLLQKLGFAFTHEELYPPTGLQHPSYLLRREKK
jgi:[ribosomal protein S5]-alanine N-acetyltransferase